MPKVELMWILFSLAKSRPTAQKYTLIKYVNLYQYYKSGDIGMGLNDLRTEGI